MEEHNDTVVPVGVVVGPVSLRFHSHKQIFGKKTNEFGKMKTAYSSIHSS